MKIFVFVNYTPDDQSLGITKKITAEIEAMKQLGHEVVYTAYGDAGVRIYDNHNKVVYEKKYGFNNNVYKKFMRYFTLVDAAQVYMSKTKEQFDVFYGRLLAPSKKYIDLLKCFKGKGCRVVLEAHAYFPGIKFTSLKGKYVSFMLEKNGRKLGKCVDRVLTEGHIENFFNIPEVREAKIGVSTERIKPHHYIGNNNELNLISVAHETAYHAYDRVVKSLSEYYAHEKKTHKIVVHIVGSISDNTRKLIEELSLGDKVILYGRKAGEELDNIYNKCNMGLGPFGQHRVGGKKDTGLKTKEYFAKGLPYIYSGEEPTVPEDYPYICRFPSDESMIDFDRVWEFYQTFVNNEKVGEDMREFARANYSWQKIMEDALSHLGNEG